MIGEEARRCNYGTLDDMSEMPRRRAALFASRNSRILPSQLWVIHAAFPMSASGPLFPRSLLFCCSARTVEKGPEGDIISSSSLRQRFCELAGRIDEKLGERAERTVLQRHDSTLDGGRRQGDWQDLHVGMCMEQSQF